MILKEVRVDLVLLEIGMTNIEFTEDEIQRYARHITLPQVGGIGQRKLMNAKVLVIGAGDRKSVV